MRLLHPTNQLDRAIAWADERREVIPPSTIAYGWRLRLRLGGDPADDEYPDKPPRMRWATYNRLLDKLRAADGVV